MDTLRKQEENFKVFEEYIKGLSNEDAKDFIIKFFKQYSYLLNEDIKRVTDSTLLSVIKKRK